MIAAIYPAVWGVGQLVTGALSDRWGRKWMIAVGMEFQAAAIVGTLVSRDVVSWSLASLLLGIGTAMVYPTLLAAIGDVAHPGWRASAVGVYRLWRDLGYGVGALLSGSVADLLGLSWAIGVGTALTAASGLVVIVRMRETHHRQAEPIAAATKQQNH